MLSDQSILTDSKIITLYTVKGSTVNLTFKIDTLAYRNSYQILKFKRSEAKKYDITLRPNITEFQMKNVTANDTGVYWIIIKVKHMQFN